MKFITGVMVNTQLSEMDKIKIINYQLKINTFNTYAKSKSFKPKKLRAANHFR
jgi:hypothetical protein